MKKLLINAASVTTATKIPFTLNADDFEGEPVLRTRGMITGDTVGIFERVAGDWISSGSLTSTTTSTVLKSLGSYAVDVTITTDVVDAVLTATVSGGTLTSLVTAIAGARYVNGTGFSFVPVGGNNDALITYDVVGGAVTNAVITTPGTGYTPEGAGYVLVGVPEALGVYVELESSGVL